MKFITDYNFKDKKTIVRCDFNVPIEDNKVVEDFKIQKSLETINYLRQDGAKIILMSHLSNSKLSLKPVVKRLEELLKQNVKFVNECVGGKVKRQIEGLNSREILLLENLRFEKGEEQNDENFAKKLAELGDLYVNDAFAVCHRSHASLIGIPKFLPHFAGFQLQKEIEILSQILKFPESPLSVIIGGVKIESKIKIIKKFLEFADHLLFGGESANTLLRVKGICIGKPWPHKEICEIIEKIDLTSQKIHLPVDVLSSPDKSGHIYIREAGPASIRKDEDNFDIGPETINLFSEIIKDSKTLFWAGPLGYFENKKFSQGTKKIAEVIADCTQQKNLFSVTGGGDTIRALKGFNLLDKFSFVSTGGGAMLTFLAGDKMPGIEALE